ncbi:MAG TPA: YwiC-like family protein [Candidatus Sulfotelmatobacter sp.]|nr:YwiC-like family protein [Candidatus Sulfotelmatobacter sp.]
MTAANSVQPRNMWGQPPSAVRVTEGDRASADFAGIEKARRERRRALIVPREHGAWGLLLVPLVTGAGVAIHEIWVPHVSPPLRDMGITLSPTVSFFLLLAAALALFWMRTPVESLLGTSAMRAQTAEERRTVGAVIAALLAVAAMTLGALLWAGRNRHLWLIGLVAGVAFAAQAALKKLGRSVRMLSEMVGTLGLTASAPAAYYVMTGKLGVTAFMLWLANFLFAGNQIHYVQLRIHTARLEGFREKLAQGWKFATGQVGMIAIVCIACALKFMPWAVLLAFAPVLLRGFAYFLQKPGPLVVRRLGWNELAQGVGFCVLLVAAFALAR